MQRSKGTYLVSREQARSLQALLRLSPDGIWISASPSVRKNKKTTVGCCDLQSVGNSITEQWQVLAAFKW